MYCQHCFTESPDDRPWCIQCGKPFIEERTPPPAQKVKAGHEGVLALVAGAAVGLYSGIFLLVLLAATLGVRWLGKKLLNPVAQAYLWAIALQAGQMLMLVAFVLVVPLMTSLPIRLDYFFLLNVAIPIAGLIWLVARPGLKPVVFLSAFQVFALVENGVNFSAMVVGSLNHKALAAHMLWRILALFLMWQSYIGARNGESSNTAVQGTLRDNAAPRP